MEEIKFSIGKKEVKELMKVLEKVKEPVSIDFLASRLKEILSEKYDFDLRERLIKVYESGNNYDEGDIIAKRFERLRVSQKGIVDFHNVATGTIYEKIMLKDNEYDLVCVDWDDQLVKKQAEFFRSNNAIQYLPINYGSGGLLKYLGQSQKEAEKDEVLHQYEEELLARIKNELLNVLFFESEFINWGSRWYLIDLVEEVEYDVVLGIKEKLSKTDSALATEYFIKEFYKIGADDARFLHYRFSLNYTMENFFSDMFICLSHHSGGKWGLRADIPEGFGARPIRICSTKIESKLRSEKKVLPRELIEQPLLELGEKWKEEKNTRLTEQEFKIFINYNEFVTNSLDIGKELAGYFPDDTEIKLRDAENVEYPVIYHYKSGFIGNLEKIFTDNRLVPGSVITFKKTDIPELLDIEIEKGKEEEKLDYIKLDYNPELDRVGILSKHYVCDTIVDERLFIEHDKIEGLEDLRKEEKQSANLFQITIKLFKLYGVPLHPIKLWHLISSIVDVNLEDVSSILSLYKCFQHCKDEVNLGKYRMNPALIGTSNLKKGLKGKSIAVSGENRIEIDANKRFYRPKFYFTTLPSAHWTVIKKFGVLPMIRLSDNIEIRSMDKVAVLFDGEVGGALQVISERETIQPHLKKLFKPQEFTSMVECRIIGEGDFEEVEIYSPPETGSFVETDAETFSRIEEHYSLVKC